MRALGLALALLLLAAAPAAAIDVDRAALLSAASPGFAWDGQRATAAAPQQSVEGFDPNKCSKSHDYYCDVTLVKLEAADETTAELEFAIFDFSVQFADFDISIFKSDASATPGDFIANGGNLSAAGLEETVNVPEAEPGYYLVTVSYYFSPDASYKGTIKATGISPPPPAAAPPAAADPPPASVEPAAAPAPLRLAARPGRRSGRRLPLRLTASAEIRSLSLVLRDARRRVVATWRTRRLSGSRTVRLRARRALRRGRYSLVAIGVSGGEKRSVTLRLRLR